jgi:hypothetical protein
MKSSPTYLTIDYLLGVAVDARGAGYQMAHEFVLRSFRDSARVAGVRKIVPQ